MPEKEISPEDLKSIKVSRDLKLAHPELVKQLTEAIASYRRMFPNRDVIITCVYRSPEEQNRLYKQGRFGNPGQILTNCDGFNKKSNHNKFPSRAVDVAITEGGKCIWDEAVFWPLGNLAKQCGLVWGGSWAGFQDTPHFELSKDVA